jgi:N-acetyl-beta-hexosaminidase
MSLLPKEIPCFKFILFFFQPQLNPTEDEVYDKLEIMYQEFHDLFKFKSFHMGADEVSIQSS